MTSAQLRSSAAASEGGGAAWYDEGGGCSDLWWPGVVAAESSGPKAVRSPGSGAPAAPSLPPTRRSAGITVLTKCPCSDDAVCSVACTDVPRSSSWCSSPSSLSQSTMLPTGGSAASMAACSPSGPSEPCASASSSSTAAAHSAGAPVPTRAGRRAGPRSSAAAAGIDSSSSPFGKARVATTW